MGMDMLGISTMITGSETMTDIHELAPAMFRLLQHTMTEKRSGVIHIC